MAGLGLSGKDDLVPLSYCKPPCASAETTTSSQDPGQHAHGALCRDLGSKEHDSQSFLFRKVSGLRQCQSLNLLEVRCLQIRALRVSDRLWFWPWFPHGTILIRLHCYAGYRVHAVQGSGKRRVPCDSSCSLYVELRKDSKVT